MILRMPVVLQIANNKHKLHHCCKPQGNTQQQVDQEQALQHNKVLCGCRLVQHNTGNTNHMASAFPLVTSDASTCTHTCSGQHSTPSQHYNGVIWPPGISCTAAVSAAYSPCIH
jgi:hypothetical protein